MKTRVVNLKEEHIHEFENEFVIYNPATGKTHLLGESAGYILKFLVIQGVSDEEAITDAIFSAAEESDETEMHEHVIEVLEQLRAASIIELI